MNDQANQLRQMMSTQQVDDQLSNRPMQVITVASGKGGVGKSNFSVNLALALKKLGRRPLILDADFGLANIEIILGERPKYNLSHFIKGECKINELLTHSKYDIPFISGGSGIREMMFLEKTEIDKISSGLGALEDESDLLIVDTGAGINDIVLKFCEIAHEVVVVITPEPTSITDGYALIKTISHQFAEAVAIKIIINKAISKSEAEEVYHKLECVTKQFLGIHIQFGGFIPYDEKLFLAVKEQVPVIIAEPRAKSSMAYVQIANTMMNSNCTQQSQKETWLQKFKKVFAK